MMLVLLLFSTGAWAQCEISGINYVYVQLPPKVLVKSGSYSAGTVLYDSGKLSGSRASLSSCYYNAYISFPWGDAYNDHALTSDHIYETGVAGIGFRIKAWINTEADGRFIGDSSTHYIGDSRVQIVNGGGIFNQWTSGYYTPQYQLQLVATGGAIPNNRPLTFSGNIAELYVDDDASSSAIVISQFNLSATMAIELTPMGCSVDATSLNFAMGTVESNTFNGSSTAGSAAQTLNLTCEPGTDVTMRVSATAAEGDNPDGSVIALTPGSTTATGVGVQLALNGTVLPLNTDISLFKSQRTKVTNTSADASYSVFTNPADPQGADGTQDLVFTSQYYKTGSTITGGEANASGTLTFTYN